jgi:hypothetical protein
VIGSVARRPIVVISAGIGAGHDGAARELTRRLSALGFPVIRHDFLDLLPAGLGRTLRDTYARQLRSVPATWGWLLRAVAGPRMSAAAAALSTSAAAERMLAAIGPDPAAVVSTYPLASQVLGRLRRLARLHTPTVAFMTDPSVHRLCVADGVDLHLAPGRPRRPPRVPAQPRPVRDDRRPAPPRTARRRTTRGGGGWLVGCGGHRGDGARHRRVGSGGSGRGLRP